ncbi:ATP-grasp domain-containing protein [Brevibacterium ravenspurgense]|uniref:ATP-binding protein n=1 Tax=Brevibacterium ravenspurgense TaxID=479117 RepID=UPI001EF2B20C|nr:biotin carboxylase N-terminal domain-containing protein [Brevibacterium ravenspurgense]MCG7301374.1 ATP-grasp domain-containing protein [Brevibacterium ravenspurgense]
MSSAANGAAQSRAIRSVLVANRGEIARRVFASCRKQGIRTVAVFSDPDANAPFVEEADVAVRLPGSAPAETYLRGDLILDAARRAGADAVHPGYGFLSENASFAKAVADAGLTWIGPSPEAIESMGSKVQAKALMDEAGVPVLKNMEPESISGSDLPVLVKASAGGGGRGMRIVERLEDLPETIAAAAREAESAFGDPTVFCERYIPTGHHIEVQVVGDEHGTVWAIGERECSIQRRHQKVVEEAPAPLVERIGESMRARLFEAAENAAARIGYTGAGTVEFLADGKGEFFFLEMNTRLQVEHPVTENVTGADLVALQLHTAQGGKLEGAPPKQTGHSIEVRLYAEDPAEDWQPQSGPVNGFAIQGVDERFDHAQARLAVESGQASLRLDAAFSDAGHTPATETGEQAISPFYDSMIAKVIATAPTRERAAAHLADALSTMEWDGPTVNRDLLVQILRSSAFLAGHTDTAFLAANPDVFAPVGSEDDLQAEAAAAAVALACCAQNEQMTTASGLVVTGDSENLGGEEALAAAIKRRNPRPQIGRFRLFEDLPGRRVLLTERGEEIEVSTSWVRGAWKVWAPVDGVEVVSASAGRVVLSTGGVQRIYRIRMRHDKVIVTSSSGSCVFAQAPRYTDPAQAVSPGSLMAPMPGTVTRVDVEVGDIVTAGQPLLWMEAMKMEHTIAADADGAVADLPVEVGDQVAAGALLAVIEGEDSE